MNLFLIVLLISCLFAMEPSLGLNTAPLPRAALDANSTAYRPVLLLHGLANDSSSMWLMQEWIEQALPGVVVVNLAVPVDTPVGSLATPLQEQTDYLCSQVRKMPQLQGVSSVNFVGYSQGALLARGFIQQCNDPPVHNFVSMVGPHGGTFGIPQVSSSSSKGVRELAELMLALKGQDAYDPKLQAHLTIAQFWRDPFDLKSFQNNSLYLARMFFFFFLIFFFNFGLLILFL